MDDAAYRRFYYTDPAPVPRNAYTGILGMTLYYADYEEAVAYYSRVLGPNVLIYSPLPPTTSQNEGMIEES